MDARVDLQDYKRVCDGNVAAAYGVLLARPQVIAFYPVTPQTPMVERLYKFRADGLLDCETVEVEGEMSAMSVVMAVTAAGGRSFTATSGTGLYFMWEIFRSPPVQRIPTVIANVSREDIPGMLLHSQQDIIGAKDAGWIQVYPETCQEILDSIIVAYRLAEDMDILLPVIVNVDGYFLSHLAEIVTIPAQDKVDRFLAPVAKTARPKLTLEPQTVNFVGVREKELAQARWEQCVAMERVKDKIVEINRDFTGIFGRDYGEMIEEYRTDDADIVLLAMGSVSGTVKVAVDRQRERGVKAGLIKVRFLRPFPRERLTQVLAGKKGIGVVDRNVCFGWNCGHLFLETKACISDLDKRVPAIDFIHGIGGLDITVEDVERAFDAVGEAASGASFKEVRWPALE